MSKPATIYDVARVAGVSITTVSNVLNKPNRVGAATRQKVLEAVDSLGYVPKADAISLARKRMNRIGVVAPFTSNASSHRRLSGVLEALSGQNIDVSVFNEESAAAADSAHVLATVPIKASLDGLIVMEKAIEDSVEERLVKHGVPVIVVDAPSSRFSTVGIDHREGGRVAARHLLELGHRRIGYLKQSQASDYESQARMRLAGFADEVQAVPGAELTVVQAVASRSAALSAAHELLDRPDRPSAVMAHYDEMATAVLSVARDLGINVPADLSVLGFDDGPVAEGAGLSTVRQPLEESGTLAANQLLADLRASSPRMATTLDVELVERSTTAPPAAAGAPTG